MTDQIDTLLVEERRFPTTPEFAARVFAIAFDALHALHQAGVQAGGLSADSLVFASTDRSAPGVRTVRIVSTGFPRRFFDPSALGVLTLIIVLALAFILMGVIGRRKDGDS